MKNAWRRFLGPVTPGARGLLLMLTVAYVVAVAGIFSHTYNVYPCLALNGPGFWKGKIWLIATYVLLPSGLLDFIFNWFMILVLGTLLERVWSRGQFWLYCLVCVIGAGIVKVIVQPSAHVAMVGTIPIVFGLLVAWGRLFANERILFWFHWEMSARQAAIIIAAAGYIVLLPCSGPITATIMLCGGLAGWLFLCAQSKILHHNASRPVISERMGRLEL
jgi:membrane associated rhomboid family serine protease